MSGCPFGQPLKFCIYKNFYSSASLLAENIKLTATMPVENNSTPKKLRFYGQISIVRI